MQKKNNAKNEKSRVAVKEAENALEKGFAEVRTPSQAAEVFDKIESAVGDVEEQDLVPEAGSADPVEQAAAIKEASDTATPKDRAAVVLTWTRPLGRHPASRRCRQ